MVPPFSLSLTERAGVRVIPRTVPPFLPLPEGEGRGEGNPAHGSAFLPLPEGEGRGEGNPVHGSAFPPLPEGEGRGEGASSLVLKHPHAVLFWS